MPNTRMLTLPALLLLLALGGCSALQPETPAVKKSPSPTALLQQKQYEQALVAMLSDKSFKVQDRRAVTTIWQTNHQLVTAQWYLQKAIVALRKGDPAEARKHLRRALKVYPHLTAGSLLLDALDRLPPGQARASRGAPAQAKPEKPPTPAGVEDIFPEGLEPSFDDLEMASHYFALGQSYFDQGRLGQASLHWRQALALDPSNHQCRASLVKLLTNQGLRYYGQGKLELAIREWEKALVFAPDNSELKGYIKKARQAKRKMGDIGKQ